MMQFRKTISACIICAILLSNLSIIQAEELNNTEDNINEQLNIEIKDLNTQLDELYNTIANELNVNIKYIKQIHSLAGSKAIYAEQNPNIYNDETVKSMDEPLLLNNANTVYKKAEFIECIDDKISRPSKYYLPDALYSVSYDIISLMSQRYHYNRGGLQIYYDSLQEEVKTNIAFYEAVLLYTGEKEESVDKLYQAYEKILYDKQQNENIIEENLDGTLKIKDKFIEIFYDIGIINETSLNYIAIMLSFDEQLAINDNAESIKEQFIVPYKVNYTSRENMMIAAMTLVGKVRYVWGGGHSGASYIDGINPMWKAWNEMYPNEATSIIIDENGEETVIINDGFETCIKPSGSWCPIHGFTNEEYHGETIYNLDDYINIRAEQFNMEELLEDKYKNMLGQVDYTNGINVHTLDGLDCSGFASWLYNQITSKYDINSTAVNFTNQHGLTEVEFGSELLPGDIFSWTTHIVIIIGKVKDGSKAYVTVEQTPNILKFGVVYYSGASSEDISYAKDIARDANLLIGNITEEPHVYCMNNMGYYTIDETEIKEINNYTIEEVWFPIWDDGVNPDYNPYDYIPEYYDYKEIVPAENGNGNTAIYYIPSNTEYIEETTTITEQKRTIGRFKDNFIDENTIISEYDKPIKDMCASEIIQYTLTKLPISYIDGYNLYEDDLFIKSKAQSNLGINIE